MTVVQLDDLTLAYKYQKANGQIVVLPQESVFHLMLMSMDGITGITPIHYAREAIGLSLQTENHGASLFKNGANASGVLKHQGALTDEALLRLKGNMEQYRGAENANKIMILEGGMDYAQIAMTQEDAQFIETRKFSRTDIAMFLGVPPHMLGDTEKSTSYGTGIEQQSRGFVTFNLQDYLTMWEDTIARDLIDEKDGSIFARFNTGALVRSDIKSRTESQVKRVQFGINTVNEVRAENDENPVDGGDVRYPPPNTNGTEGDGNEPETPTED
jgi:HK97 family phage portal protein